MSAERPLILHVSSLGGGGAETALFRLVTNDRAFRHHVVSLTGLERYGQPLLDAGISVTTLDLPRGRLRLAALSRLWKLMRSEQPYAVQTWMYHSDLIGGLTARMALQRRVFWNIRHSSLSPSSNNRKTIAIAKGGALLSRLVPSRIICCADSALKTHSQLGYDPKRMIVIPNGYELGELYPDDQASGALRSSLAIPADEPLIGMIARYAPEKDHANLFAALSLLTRTRDRFTVLLAGENITSQNSTLVSMIERSGLSDRTRLLGPRKDIRALMSALDLHVLSSSSEGFPNVVAEAMACGALPVVTDAGDAAEIVGGHGWVVPISDPEALAQAMNEALEICQQPDESRRWRERARNRILQTYGIEQMVARYNSVWLGRPQE